MNKTVKELRADAKMYGVKNYSKMTKEELYNAIANSDAYLAECQRAYGDDESEMPSDVEELLNDETVITQNDVEIRKEDVQMERVLNNSEVKDFVNKYKGFVLYDSLRNNSPMVRQINLAKAIVNNFDTEILIASYKTAGQLSDDLAMLLNKIESGELKARPKSEVAELVKAYKPATAQVAKNITTTNPASKAQIAYINRLEKETGVVNHRIVSDVKVANEIIQYYLKLKKEQSVLSEVAVDNAKPACFGHYDEMQAKFEDKSFRTKFIAFLKRALA